MTTPQAEEVQRQFLPLLDDAICSLRAQAVDHDGLLADAIDDGEVVALVYAAFAFFIASEARLSPQAGLLNGALASALTGAISYYADRGRVGKRPFHEDERASFAQGIYVHVHRGLNDYAPSLRKDVREISHRQTIVFADTCRHFLSRYVTEPALLARMTTSRLAYATIVDRLLDGITACLAME